MELVGLGVDVAEIDRVAAALARFGERFLRRVYTPAEAGRCCRRRAGQREACLAGRFAAKEAVMKALGTGARGVGFREIELRSQPTGQPAVQLAGRARERASRMGVEGFLVSITHGRDVAVAVAIAWRRARAAGDPR